MTRGTVAIAAMFLVGVAMAGFAWWARYNQGQQILRLWGPEAVVAVRTSPRVRLLRLRVAAGDEAADVMVASSDSGSPEPNRLVITDSRDISDAPGLIHARHHLLHRNAFVWDAVGPDYTLITLRRGLRFEQAATTATILFDSDHSWGYLVERRVWVNMAPILDALRTFVEGL